MSSVKVAGAEIPGGEAGIGLWRCSRKESGDTLSEIPPPGRKRCYKRGAAGVGCTGPAPDHIRDGARNWPTPKIRHIRHFRGYNRSRQPGARSRSTTATGCSIRNTMGFARCAMSRAGAAAWSLDEGMPSPGSMRCAGRSPRPSVATSCPSLASTRRSSMVR